MAGYNESFLEGVILPIPKFNTILSSEVLNQGEVFHYPTYSVVANSSPDKRSPVIVCLNIDQALLKGTSRSDRWRIDPRIQFENQLDNDYYAFNPWDRGHMARRTSAAWGSSMRDAQYAADETFYYSNSALQHANLNQDEWLGLEDWVFGLELDKDGKITSFSGPIYGDFDRSIRPSGRRTALIPAGFFKVVCFINKDTEQLDVRAFVIYQDAEALADKSGRTRYDNQHYQVTVTEIEELTGLRFDDSVYEANPLYYSGANAKPEEHVSNFPEQIEVAKPADLVAAGDQRQTIKDDIVDIFIAAAMPNPEGSEASNEWVSLLNLGSQAIDLTGWALSDNSDKRLVIDTVVGDPASRVLGPGESIVVKGLKPLRLANTGDIIKLYDADGARIDWVNYTKPMVRSGEPVVFLSPRSTLDV
jgi:endonuclease G